MGGPKPLSAWCLFARSVGAPCMGAGSVQGSRRGKGDARGTFFLFHAFTALLTRLARGEQPRLSTKKKILFGRSCRPLSHNCWAGCLDTMPIARHVFYLKGVALR